MLEEAIMKRCHRRHGAQHGLPFAVALCAFQVHADAPPVEPPEAAGATTEAPVSDEDFSAILALAVFEHERSNFQEARTHFLRAHALRPSARTLRALGKVEYELRNYGEAAGHFRSALVSEVSPLTAELRGEVNRLLRQAEAYLGQLHVSVDPDSATIVIDGMTVATGPTASVSLVVGDHVLEFRARGRVSERRAVRISPGQRTEIDVLLASVEQEDPVSSAKAEIAQPRNNPDVTTTPQSSHTNRKWLWASLGVVGAALVAGIVVALARSSPQREIAPIHDTDGRVVDGPVVSGSRSQP